MTLYNGLINLVQAGDTPITDPARAQPDSDLVKDIRTGATGAKIVTKYLANKLDLTLSVKANDLFSYFGALKDRKDIASQKPSGILMMRVRSRHSSRRSPT